MVIGFRLLISTKLEWIYGLLFILATTIRVHGQHSTSGFLSIDCGLTNRSTYKDIDTGIQYLSDGEFVESGLSYEIARELIADATNEQEKTLRSFPDGSRNCYTLPATAGNKFLLRATFTYGNYDGLNKSLDGSLFLFGLHIGVNFWATVNLTKADPSNTYWNEVLTIAPSNFVSVCLVNFGSGTPFVSTLDLRPLGDGMYPFVKSSVSFSYFFRIRFGNIPYFITRYPIDPYDRFWESGTHNSTTWSPLSTNREVKWLPGKDDEFQLPQAILQKASTIFSNVSSLNITRRVSGNLQVSGNPDAKSLELLPIFHFAEIVDDSSNRVFDIYSGGVLLFPDYTPPKFRVESTYKKGQFLRNATAFFSLRKTPNSTLSPLINAFELYWLVRMDNFTTASDDIDCMKEVKKHYNLARTNWNGDPCSPREYSWDGLTCDYSKSNQNPRVVGVNLSNSGLRGGLSISFLNMSSLENLDLSHNNLTGAIPDNPLKLIKVLDLSSNQLDGPIPDSILQRFQAGQLDLRLEGNPICSKVKDTYCSNKKNTIHVLLITVIVPVALVSLLVVMCILWKLYWKGKSGDHEDYAMYEEETPLHIDTRRFTYAELKLITNDFHSIIGKGGFGTVYHGIMENGDDVAVKVLMETSISESTDFLPEVQTLSRVHHKNLVTLEGYCQNKKCLALVYDFMPRGNLQEHLRGDRSYILNWEERLHIALDAAQGLEYLHESCTPPIVHRDVKTANILLDKNLVGIISDFGLSRAFNDAHMHISTVAAGTLGYLDPEYHATFQLTVKTDVYSFGVVLLEIVTGRPPVFMDLQTVHLPNWVRQKIANGSVHDVVDKRLSDQYDASSVQSVIGLAMNCLENAAINRPTMPKVVSRLKVCLSAVPSEEPSVSASHQRRDAIDTETARQQRELLPSGYTSGMSEISQLSGR